MVHQKHSNTKRATFGQFARHEIAFLGTPCDQIKTLFETIISALPTKKLGIIEADHKAEETIASTIKYTDKINFGRYDTHSQPNSFERRAYFESLDLLLINGNHFEGKYQILVIDSAKSVEKKLAKLNNVILCIHKAGDIPNYLKEHFGEHFPPILPWQSHEKIVEFISQFIDNHKPKLCGLVLAGGKSTRMGYDKGLLQYHGQTQRQWGMQLLSKYCCEVYLSVNQSQLIDLEAETPHILDEFLNMGPLGGILSAFKKEPDAAWLVMACDMPFVSAKALDHLVVNRDTTKFATTYRSPMDDFPEPLLSIFEPRMYPKFLQMLAYGYDCPRKALINSDIQLLEPIDTKSLSNINTTEEYEKTVVDLSVKLA